MIAARWLVLFPGAAHASITVDPCGGERIKAGKQLALSWKIISPALYNLQHRFVYI